MAAPATGTNYRPDGVVTLDFTCHPPPYPADGTCPVTRCCHACHLGCSCLCVDSHACNHYLVLVWTHGVAFPPALIHMLQTPAIPYYYHNVVHGSSRHSPQPWFSFPGMPNYYPNPTTLYPTTTSLPHLPPSPKRWVTPSPGPPPVPAQ